MSILTRSTFLLCLFGMLLTSVLGGCGGSSTQRRVVGRDVEKRVYLVEGQKVSKPPEIVGGYQKIDELKKYPESAEKDGAYGVIWMQCTVSAGGAATRVQLAQGGHPALETEALNVIKKLQFRPAQINGAPVQSQVQIPVIFQGPYAQPKKKKKKKA